MHFLAPKEKHIKQHTLYQIILEVLNVKARNLGKNPSYASFHRLFLKLHSGFGANSLKEKKNGFCLFVKRQGVFEDM